MESLNKSVNHNGNKTHLRFAAVSIKEKKMKDEGKVTKQKVHKRIRWQLKENQKLSTFFVKSNHMDNEIHIE